MNDFFSIDRIEDYFAVVEAPDKKFFSISLSLLPEGIKEGSILTKNSDGIFFINEQEEQNRKKTNYNLQNSIFGEKL